MLGRPCLCGDKTLAFPAAVRGGRAGAHDSLGSIISIVVDLSHAADQLPLRWRETRRIFVVQERGDEWRRRMGLASTGRQFRLKDFDPDLGRVHTRAIMAFHLGWTGVQRWPKARTWG